MTSPDDRTITVTLTPAEAAAAFAALTQQLADQQRRLSTDRDLFDGPTLDLLAQQANTTRAALDALNQA